MLKRILLIDVDNFDQSNKDSILYSNWTNHPLGLMYLASAAQKNFPSLDIKIFHTITSKQPLEHIKSLISQFSPDLIGLRALSIAQPYFNKVARIIREINPKTPLIAGGPLASSHYEAILSGNIVDLIVLGEGEDTFVELLSNFIKNSTLPQNIPGTAILEDDRIVVNSPQMYIQNLDRLPFPNYNLINLSDYEGISNISFQDCSKSAFIYSSRGCPYQCFYCHNFFGKKIRHRSPHNVVEEMLEHFEKRGIQDFVFVDDAFNVPMNIAKNTLSLIIKKLPGVRINFSNGLRADQMDEELIDLLEKAGTVHIALAIETASKRLQKIVGKNLNLEKAEKSIHASSKRFITCAYFMIGFPTETYEEAMETIQFAEQFDHLAQPVFTVVRVYKGTSLYRMLNPNEEQAKLLKEQEQYSYQPKKMSKDLFFYGDIFPDEKVPLKSQKIRILRLEWFRRVVMNKNRIKNTYNIIQKFFDQQQILRFYRLFYDDKNFNEQSLQELLEVAK